MKKLLCLVATLAFIVTVFAEGTVQKTVLTVDQDGQMNVAGVATITDLAQNAVKIQVAEAAAEAAQATATSVTNAVDSIVQNIMAGNTVIYRYGYTDSFDSLVILTDSDKVIISYFKPTLTGTTLTAEIHYVCTANIGQTKPIVYASPDIDVGKNNFDIVEDANVTVPVYHDEEVVVKDVTYSGYYAVTVTIYDVSPGKQYFYWIKIDPDTPSGDGISLELPNGVVGGATTTVTWGDKVLTFNKGMLTGVTEQ